MKSEKVSTEELRKKFNEYDFGEANCPFHDKNFANEISKKPPGGYPFRDEWRKAAEGK